MARCPNCGQKTSRTEDWACQHCGYPLPFGPYKKINKKYQDIKAENRPATPAREEPPEPVMYQSPQPPPPSYQPVTQYAPPPPPPPVRAPEPELPPPPVQPLVQQTAPPPTPVVAPPQVMPATPPPVQAAPLPPPVAATPAPVRPPEPELPLEPITEGLDVEKLFAILAQNYSAALGAYQGKALKIKGQVLRTVISDAIDINYLLLTGEKEPGQKQISCTFSKKREGEIARLHGGETVTVEGTMRIKYDGTRFNVLMKDCALYR